VDEIVILRQIADQADLVINVAQPNYFKNRTDINLQTSKAAEAKLRELLGMRKKGRSVEQAELL
jgi:hypothetical protein